MYKTMKRTSRKLSEETRRKISKALAGKPKSEQHRQALSRSLVAYWSTIPTDDYSGVEKEDITPLL